MKLIAQIKLLPSSEQHAALLHTLKTVNMASNYVSREAWRTRTFNEFSLHYLTYKTVRKKFNLGGCITQRVFSKVSSAYKLDHKTPRVFKPLGAFPLNKSLVSYKLATSSVSVWTMFGRQKIPFICGVHQLKLLQSLHGECLLVYRDNKFYLFQACDVREQPEVEASDFLGVDLGIANIAVDSDGVVYHGGTINNVRFRYRRLRYRLRNKRTKSSYRHLKRLSGRERRFATNINHCISKQIVHTAQGTARGIALEDLGGIRERVTVRRGQRVQLHNWSFAQFRNFTTYKARRVGVPVLCVDPRNTSRTCPSCGCVDKRNRPTQSKFSCIQCGFAGLADYIAAVNIRCRAIANWPNVSTMPCVTESPGIASGTSQELCSRPLAPEFALKKKDKETKQCPI